MEITTIKLKNKSYPILFSVNVAEAVQKKYGGVEKIAEVLDDIGEVKWILALIINEGIDYCNYIKGESNKNITVKELGMLLSMKDLHSQVLGQHIIKAFNESMQIEGEDPEDNDQGKND